MLARHVVEPDDECLHLCEVRVADDLVDLLIARHLGDVSVGRRSRALRQRMLGLEM